MVAADLPKKRKPHTLSRTVRRFDDGNILVGVARNDALRRLSDQAAFSDCS
jgi:hypothetical protein